MMEFFGIGWRITALVVIFQLIVLASASTEGDNVAISNNDTKLLASTSENNTEETQNDTSRKGDLESEPTSESFVSKVEKIVCSSIGLLCPSDSNSNKTESADADNKTKVETTTLEKEKGRNEKEKNSALTDADKGTGKEKDSRSSSSNSSADDKKSETDS